MGNALRLLAACLRDPKQEQQVGYGYSQQAGYGGADYGAFARDLLHFESTGQTPEGLSRHVKATQATQRIWYRKLLNAWKESPHPPSSPADVAQFIVKTLNTRRKSDEEGILQYYGLLAHELPSSAPASAQGSWPEGVQYELTSMPVEAHDIPDGDTLTIYVDVSKDAREAQAVPSDVSEAIRSRRNARSRRDYSTADGLQKQIMLAGYKVFDAKNGKSEAVARKYRIRLRGVDAPEKAMPHGTESKAELRKLVEGERLRLLVYTADQYGRLVADVHIRDCFVQEVLLKRGCVWHYATYDARPEFAEWEAGARRARVGLWAAKNPQKPWEYRKQ